MTAADDAAILSALQAVPNLRVFDGYVTDSDESAKTISAPLPYVVFYGFADDDAPGDTLARSLGAHLVEFQITYVGATREQARLVGERALGALNRKWLTLPAGLRLVCRTDSGLGVRRDDVWTRPGGGPLFVGEDRYRVGA